MRKHSARWSVTAPACSGVDKCGSSVSARTRWIGESADSLENGGDVGCGLPGNGCFCSCRHFGSAEGFGQFATGGRGGTVYHVTNLNDSGPGSFRDAVGTSNRIVVFDIGGYINLQSAVSVKSNITIAGQTAPGDGIGIMGREVSFDAASNVIVRHIRFRQGDLDPDSGKSGINLLNATNMALDHVSIEFRSGTISTPSGPIRSRSSIRSSPTRSASNLTPIPKRSAGVSPGPTIFSPMPTTAVRSPRSMTSSSTMSSIIFRPVTPPGIPARLSRMT